MLILTTETIPNQKYIPLGIVKGSSIESINIFKDLGSFLKTLVGGELLAYTKMLEKARLLATQKMLSEAEQLGADAIIAVRYTSASVMSSAAEMMVYGTAIKFES